MHFKWAVAHASELYRIYDRHIRKTPGGHASSFKKIKYAKMVVKAVEAGRLTWPENLTVEEIRAELEAIHERKAKKAKESGPPLVASRGVPRGVACAVVAVDKEWRHKLNIKPSPKLHAIRAYRKYHEAKHALDKAPWYP